MTEIVIRPRRGARPTADQAREGICPRCILRLALEAAQAGNEAGDEDLTPDPSTHDPASIGPYRIVRRLGAGGMGMVYLAEQVEPIRREVALKVIRKGLDTATR
jgi:serine/threonine protein kinase